MDKVKECVEKKYVSHIYLFLKGIVICFMLFARVDMVSANAITFSNIKVTAIKDTSVVIQWDTDVAATGQIEYGLTANYGNLTEEKNLSYWQSIEITNLTKEKTYHYRIRANNYKNKRTMSGDNTFITRSTEELENTIRAVRINDDLPKIYYVKPEGDNSESGLTVDAAWATPAYAAAQAEAGDTIYVLEGNYVGGVDFGHYVGHNGIPEAPITMKAYNGIPDISGTIDIRADYIIFDGFICHDAGGFVIDLRYNTGIKILNCEVYNSGIDCIYLRDATYVILENCVVHDSGWNGFGLKPSTSWPASGHHIMLKNCEAYDIMAHNAFDVQDDYATYENCYAHHSLLAPLRIKGEHVVINNFTGEEGNNGIHFTGSFINSIVINCTFPDMGLYQSGGITENTIICNNSTNWLSAGIGLEVGTNVLIEKNEIYTNELWGYTYGFRGTGNVIIKNENVTTLEANMYKVRSLEGATVTVNYTDNRTFSVDGEGEHTIYTFSSGARTINVFGEADTIRPVITNYSPAGTGVPIDTNISVVFSEPMNTSTMMENTIFISPSVPGSFTCSGNEMIFDPDLDLNYGTTYIITTGRGVEDLAENSLESEYTWQFTTRGKFIEGKVFVSPNPYIAGRSAPNRITFSNLPKEATIKTYTVSGDLVKTIKHKDIADGGSQDWDISGVASGIYIYSIISPSGNKEGKVAIVK